MSKVAFLLTGAVALVAFSASLMVNLAFGDDGDQPKDVFLELEAQMNDAAARRAAELEAAGEGPSTAIPTLPESCPSPKPDRTGVLEWGGRGTPPNKMLVSNLATLIGAETYTTVWAGSGVGDDGNTVGVLVLESSFADPCAQPNGRGEALSEGFSFDETEGRLTITAAEGNLVDFESASGKRGSINTDTGELTVPDDFQPLPVPTAPALEVTPVPAN